MAANLGELLSPSRGVSRRNDILFSWRRNAWWRAANGVIVHLLHSLAEQCCENQPWGGGRNCVLELSGAWEGDLPALRPLLAVPCGDLLLSCVTWQWLAGKKKKKSLPL